MFGTFFYTDIEVEITTHLSNKCSLSWLLSSKHLYKSQESENRLLFYKLVTCHAT